jgi:glycosyltransferase involved in cell wall biosynthesis
MIEHENAGERLHVGLFCDCHSRGGVLTYTCQLGRAVRPRGFRVTVFTSRPRDEAAEMILQDLRAGADDLCLIEDHDDPGSFISEMVRSVAGSGVRLFVPNYRWMAYAACAAASRFADIRIVGICHNDDPSYYGLLCHYAHVIQGYVCPSRKTWTALRTRLAHRADDIQLIPHGVPVPARGASGYDGGEIRLLYHGRLEEEQKNVSALLAVARRLRNESVRFKLRLAGTGSCAGQYRESLGAEGLTDSVEFLGACDPGRLQELFRDSHLAVLTSRYEGFCLSLAEAMAASLPGVAFACGEVIEEYLREGVNGFVVPFGDVAAMAERVRWFTRNPERWNDFSRAARAAIRERYSLDSFGERYARCFRQLSQCGRRRKWPRLRPVYVPAGKRTLHGVVERAGRLVGAWG